MKSTLIVCGAALVAAGSAHAVSVEFVLGESNITGTTEWDIFESGGGPVDMGMNGSGDTITMTTASGQTGGGVIDDSVTVASSNLMVMGGVVNAFGGGTTAINFRVDADAFILPGYTGMIESDANAFIVFDIDQATTFTETVTGNIDAFSLTAQTGSIVGDMLMPGRYELFGRVEIVASGEDSTANANGNYILTLGTPVIPLPGAFASGLGGLALVTLRRRR